MPDHSPQALRNKANGDFPIDEVVERLLREMAQWEEPIVTKMTRNKRDPFKVLIATILSLRTKDSCTAEASRRLFKLARSPRGMLKLDRGLIEKTIYPVGFYKNKARHIHETCQELISRFGGKTPDTLEELLTLKGVGRKTANLVLTKGFGLPGICVDTHVHRICNRWGYIQTQNPDETELVLREVLPQKHWIPINDLLVTYGQNLCVPISPWCGRCVLADLCAKNGVERSR